MQLADSIMRERRFPKFKIDEDKSELEFNKSYIEELRAQVSRIFLFEMVSIWDSQTYYQLDILFDIQVNLLMANLEHVPVSRSTHAQNYSRIIQKVQGNPLSILDHKTEDEA